MRKSRNGWLRLALCLIATVGPAGILGAEESASAAVSGVAVRGLPDLEALALRHNPTLAQAAAQVAASRGKAVQAGLWLNPTVGYVGEQIGIEGSAGEMQGGFVQQTILTAGKLRLSRAKYRQEAAEAEILATAQQLRVLNGVRLQFFAVLARQRHLDLKRQLQANADENRRTHQEMFNTGQANRAEVLLAEVAANRARLAVVAEQNHLAADLQTLAALVGVPELAATTLHGQLECDGPPIDWETSLTRLLQDSPELHASQAHVVHDQIQLQRERVQPVPNVMLQASAGYSYETQDAVAGAQVGFNIPLWDRNQGTIRQAQADLARSHAEVRRVELALRQRLADHFSRYSTALETVRTYRDETIPKVTEARDLMRDMYEKRRAPWVQAVAMEREFLRTQEEYTDSLLELRKAEVAITGLLLVDGLQPPAAPLPSGHIDATPRPR